MSDTRSTTAPGRAAEGLTAGGPGGNRSPGLAQHPEHRVEFRREPRHARVTYAGETIAESGDVVTVHETRHAPVYYFPRGDVRMDLLTPSDHGTHCPFKGDARYWTVAVGGNRLENAAFSYERPYDEAESIRGRIAFWAERFPDLALDPPVSSAPAVGDAVR